MQTSEKVYVSFRVVPQTPVAEVMQVLGDLADPYDISIEQVAEAFPSPPSPLTPSIVESFNDSLQYWYRLVKRLSGG